MLVCLIRFVVDYVFLLKPSQFCLHHAVNLFRCVSVKCTFINCYDIIDQNHIASKQVLLQTRLSTFSIKSSKFQQLMHIRACLLLPFNKLVSTVNSEIFANILFSRIALKDFFFTLESLLGHDLPTSDFAISRGFYFHETSHRSFAKIKHSRKFRIYSVSRKCHKHISQTNSMHLGEKTPEHTHKQRIKQE